MWLLHINDNTAGIIYLVSKINALNYNRREMVPSCHEGTMILVKFNISNDNRRVMVPTWHEGPTILVKLAIDA